MYPGINTYDDMVEAVACLDEKAAEYLRLDAPHIYGFTPFPNLLNCMLWSKTPQGNSFWSTMHARLNSGDHLYSSRWLIYKPRPVLVAAGKSPDVAIMNELEAKPTPRKWRVRDFKLE